MKNMKKTKRMVWGLWAVAAIALGVGLWPWPQRAASAAPPSEAGIENGDACAWPAGGGGAAMPADPTAGGGGAAMPADPTAGGGGAAIATAMATDPPFGGNIRPIRCVEDFYPTFDGLAIDPVNNRVAMSDENGHGLLIYAGAAGSHSEDMTEPLTRITGPATQISFAAGVMVDPSRREVYTVNNDGVRMMVFHYTDRGDATPIRTLDVPHQAWGLAMNLERNEIAVTVEQLHLIAIYRRDATGVGVPLRVIDGPRTGMADPHGISWDVKNHEIFVANQGNYSVITSYGTGQLPTTNLVGFESGGHFQDPSITVYSETAKGNTAPVRTIQGSQTGLDWPMGIAVDSQHNEVVVANNGDDSILVFRRTEDGNVAPIRVIRGPKTGINGPVGVGVDPRNNEIWIANFNDHTALLFPREASGNVAPERIIRNAPAGTPAAGFDNPKPCAYDSKRQEILVPN